MKKVVLFSVISLMLFGCNGSQNESNANENDPILGTWKLTSKTLHTTVDTPIALKPCELETTYTFKAEGAKFTGEQLTYHTATTDCGTEALLGRWGHENDSYYMIYNNNTVSVTWSEVIISGSTMTASVVNGESSTVYTWTKQ
ncbi:MAG: lipocalin family protein [Flavobacterium sp.]|nr:lipocalin family protein [Flavobacterium sp.]